MFIDLTRLLLEGASFENVIHFTRFLAYCIHCYAQYRMTQRMKYRIYYA